MAVEKNITDLSTPEKRREALSDGERKAILFKFTEAVDAHNSGCVSLMMLLSTQAHRLNRSEQVDEKTCDAWYRTVTQLLEAARVAVREGRLTLRELPAGLPANHTPRVREWYGRDDAGKQLAERFPDRALMVDRIEGAAWLASLRRNIDVEWLDPQTAVEIELGWASPLAQPNPQKWLDPQAAVESGQVDGRYSGRNMATRLMAEAANLIANSGGLVSPAAVYARLMELASDRDGFQVCAGRVEWAASSTKNNPMKEITLNAVKGWLARQKQDTKSQP